MRHVLKFKLLVALVGVWILFFSLGGIFVLLVFDQVFLNGKGGFSGGLNWLLVGLGLLLLTGKSLVRELGKDFLFYILLSALLIISGLVGANILCKSFLPSYPGRILHGKSAEQIKTAYIKEEMSHGSENISVNSWGQLDTEHGIKKAPRIVLIGDSFLEIPFDYPLGNKLQKLYPQREWVNLGVVGSAPDEYYYRALELAPYVKADKALIFVFAGNDYIGSRTLRSWWGMAAVSPRPSFLCLLGFCALNDFFTTTERPFLSAWKNSFDLGKREREIQEILLQAKNGEHLRELIISQGVAEKDRQELLRSKWKDRDFGDFLKALRNPDQGKFRSYYLGLAQNYSQAVERQFATSIDMSFYFLERAVRELKKKGIDATIVLIPDPFHVDVRMIKLWSVLEDIEKIMSITRERTLEIKAKLESANIKVLDLYDSLKGKEASYQNFDGHWSPQGVDRVAEALKMIAEN